MIRRKKLLIYLIITQKLNLNLFIDQNMMNLREKDINKKILTPKQMLQRLPIALAQVKAGNNSESLLNQIRQIVYSLYQSKQITKKVYNHIIESIQ